MTNISCVHGAWGEDLATSYLETMGYKILERNVRPCKWDRRLEIDIIAIEKKKNTLVFVEVKQHKTHSQYERRLRSITKEKKRLLRLACRAWLAKNHWQDSYRFDVIEIFGYPGMKERAELDHIERVNLFVNENNAFNWF